MPTIEFKYPLRMRAVRSGNIADFISLDTAVYLEVNTGIYKVGETRGSLVPHTDIDTWEPYRPLVSLKEIYANY